MRKLAAVVAAGLLGLGLAALWSSPASAELKTSISGSIRLNAEYSDVIANNGTAQEISPTNIPFTKGFQKCPGPPPCAGRERDNDQFHIDARRTRIQLDMSDQVGSVKVSGRFQGDFDTSDGNAKNSNSRHFRIRLGWGQWQTASGWIVRFGQLRTMLSEYGDNLFGGVADPDIIDENGHWDNLSARQPGVNIGYATKFMGGDLLVGGVVENPATDVLRQNSPPPGVVGLPGVVGIPAATTVDPAQSTGEDIPMFGVAARLRTPLWAVFGRAATQNHRLIMDGSPGPNLGPKDGSTRRYQGWLAALGAEVTTGPFRIMGQYWYGDGLNRIAGVFSDVHTTTGGFVGQPGTGPTFASLKVLPIITDNWHAGVENKLTKNLKAIVSYHQLEARADRRIFNLTGQSPDKRLFRVVYADLIYGFWERFDIAIGYEWGKVKSFGSSEGTLNAINSRLRFYF